MTNNVIALKRLAGICALVGVAMPASAALVTLNGDNIDIVYDNAQPSLLAYGMPSLVGNLLTFSPSNFAAVATNGGLDVEANTINFKIVVHDLYRINSVSFSEGGDYVMWGSGSIVSVGGQTRVFDTAQIPPGVVQAIGPAAPLTTINPVPVLATTNWSASTFSDLSSANYANTRELSFSVQNILAAGALDPQGGFSLALIEKKYVALDVSVTPVPEPETWAMMLIGAGLVGFRLRNRSKKVAANRFV